MSDKAVPGVSVSLQELLALRTQPLPGRQPQAGSSARSAGRHAALHRARGIEFAELRAYQPGDDARAIDWRQTARRGRPYTRLFQAEHARTLRLLVDMGPSMRFATRGAYKSVAAARAATLLAWRAVTLGERVGGLVVGAGSLPAIAPLPRHHGVLALLSQLAFASQAAPVAAPLAESLRAMRKCLLPGTQVLLLSDFATLDDAAERELLALSLQAEVMMFHIYDIFECSPPSGRYPLSDGRQTGMLDLADAAVRADYLGGFNVRADRLARLARRVQAPLLALATHEDPRTKLGWNQASVTPVYASP